MCSLAVGDKVHHPKIKDWGLGKILDLTADGKAKVFFINGGEKTISLKHVSLKKIEGEDAVHPILDNPNFAKLAAGGKKHKGLPDGRLEFLEIFLEGFEDPAYLATERTYKLDACKLMQKLLGKGEFAKLLESGEEYEIVRRALQVANKTNLIFPNEKMALKDGLKTAENVSLFSRTLFDLLYGSEEYRTRFEAFAGCLERIDAAKWTTMTYFPFLLYPEEHMFLKPQITQHAADLTKFELNYKSELNWLTYSCLIDFAAYLRDELVKMDMPPRDMIDVQSFMWCITPGKYDMVEGLAFKPTMEVYRRALREMAADGHFESNQYRTMLKAQYDADSHIITATRLAEAAGYINYNAANLHYGTLGRMLPVYLGYLPPKRPDETRMWWQTLSLGNAASEGTLDGHFEFVMRPELANALKALRWV